VGVLRSQHVVLLVVAVTLVTLGTPAGAPAETPAADTAADPLFGDPNAATPGFPDPFEPLNRGFFVVNRQADRWVITPVTSAYTKVVPGVVRRSMRRFFTNLNSPSIVANDLLQREWHDASVTTVRTLVNSTLGVAGLADTATQLGFPSHHSDFGQTLALGGVSSGPYLMLPLLGPTTLRDGFGVLVDFAFRPTTYLFGSALFAELLPGVPGVAGVQDQLIYGTIQGGGSGLVVREQHAEQLRALEESSIDYYATLRSAYYQNRQAAIWARREHHKPRAPAPPPAVRLCRPRGPRSSPAGKFPVPRSRRDRSRRCSPIDAAPARSPSP
jgi:phospholipid-binding lipoprotein MlaA